MFGILLFLLSSIALHWTFSILLLASVNVATFYSLSLFVVFIFFSWALGVAASSSCLYPYTPTPGDRSIFHLLFADNCLLLDRESIQNVVAFFKILKKYCHASRQTVNLLKFAIIFSLKMKIQPRNAIRQRLGMVEQEGVWHYLNILISDRRSRKVDCSRLERAIQECLPRW